MTALLSAACGLLLHSTLLLAVGLLALRLTRKRGPALQSLVGRATLTSLALLLLATPLTSYLPTVWRVTLPEVNATHLLASQVPPATGGLGEVAVGSPSASRGHLLSGSGQEYAEEAKVVTPRPPVAGGPQQSRLRQSQEVGSSATNSLLYPTLAAVWLFGTTAMLLWLGLCQWHLMRLRRTAQPVLSGLAWETLASLTPHPPCLLTHPQALSPFLAGIRCPSIFLPLTYQAEFDPAALRAIFIHELAHLTRRDNGWTLAARLLTALYWPQPLLWLLCRRLEQIGEEACDEAVLARDCSPRAYADCLLTLAARHPLGRRERALGAGVTPFRSSVGRRIGRILEKGTASMSTISLRLRLSIAAGSAIAVLGGAFLVSSAPAQLPESASAALTPEQQKFKALRLQDEMNLKVIGIAFIAYAQDHDEYYPSALHWMDALSPYLEDKTVLFDPFQPGARRYGYALNRNCSGKSLATFSQPSQTIAVFDSTLGTRNASDMGQSLRARTFGSQSGSSYLYIDGHVKWINKPHIPPFSIQWDRRWHNSPPPGYYRKPVAATSLRIRKSQYAKPIVGVPLKQKQLRSTIAFLDAQIQGLWPRLRAAQGALSAYKAGYHPQTIHSQRKLAELTRNYFSMNDLYSTLVRKRQDMQLQLNLDTVKSKPKARAQGEFKSQP
jgi:beta-lactamase regulating signal transducer with metallopeptidase domain